MSEARAVSPEHVLDDAPEPALRPGSLGEFVGQRQLCDNLRVFIQAARGRGEALDHVLFHGPPGLGKTTLAQIVARELAVGFRATSGPVIARAGDLAAILTNLQPQRRLCSLTKSTGSTRRSRKSSIRRWRIMQLDLIIGEGPAARSVQD